MAPLKRLTYSLASAFSNLKKTENFIEQVIYEFQLPPSFKGEISLCILESVKNSMIHGNKLNPEKMVNITAEQYSDRITVTVEDEGEGFDYTVLPNPIGAENILKECGRGLYLMSILSDELKFYSGGRKVVMSFFHKNEDTV